MFQGFQSALNTLLIPPTVIVWNSKIDADVVSLYNHFYSLGSIPLRKGAHYNKQAHSNIVQQLFATSEPLDSYLDFGCGDCNRTETIASALGIDDYYSCDIAKQNGRGFFLVEANNPAIPSGFPQQYDLVSLLNVIHHIPSFCTTHLDFIASITKKYLLIREHDSIEDSAFIKGYHIPFACMENQPLSYIDDITLYSASELETILWPHFRKVRATSPVNTQRTYYALYQRTNHLASK